MDIVPFKQIVYDYYYQHQRSFVWRQEPTPYFVFISEVMLQQTQTYRVAPKFDQFITAFPDFPALADASFAQVLQVWQGLGYNRRALYLQQAARIIAKEFSGTLPDEPTVLQELPGIGSATARSICAFAFNKPTIFIETNIRTVFIHFFFPGQQQIHDKQLLPLVEQTLDYADPRQWYYALMDYGVMLKQTVGNVSRKSAHYAKQSKFEGSDRQLRAAILRLLLVQKAITKEEIGLSLKQDRERVERILQGLLKDNLIKQRASYFELA